MIPSEYIFQKYAILRGLSQATNFKRLESGFYGEEKFHQYIKEFGSDHWTILRNKWFKNDSPFECDSILITRHAIYVFEVKNYYGKFVYKNGQSYSRGHAITYNPVNQARNARLHLQHLLRDFTVKGALVFIGEHNQVCIHDEINDIATLETNEVYEFVQQIKREEQQYNGPSIHVPDVIKKLERFEIDPPYQPVPYTRKAMAAAKTGIFCANCQQKVAISRAKYIKCKCGLHESKEEAIARTACEYGVLTYGQDFTVSDILSFLGEQISRDYLRNLLCKYFKRVSKGKIFTFQNPNQDISQLSMKFPLPKQMILDTHHLPFLR